MDSLKGQDGRIILKPGQHYSGPLKIPSHINLHLDEGAELLFSDDFSLCPAVLTRWEGTECYALRALIFAEDSSGITISGRGTINGQGARWWSSYRNMRKGLVSREVKEVQERLIPLNREIGGGSGGGGRETGFLRPSLIQFKNCSGIRIEGVTLKNSPFWNTHILYSRDVALENLSFINPYDAPNSDGLDIDSSENVTVDGCRFDVGDDCLCLKSGMDADGIRVGKPTAHVNVKNCSMEHGHGAVVIGSETSGGISHITVENCRMRGTDRGIRVKTRRGRGGTVENIRLKNLEMDGVSAPIVMNMYYRCGAGEDEAERLASLEIPEIIERTSTPVIRDIVIENIHAKNIRSAAAFFLGLPESPIERISITGFTAESEEDRPIEEPAMDLFHTKTASPAIMRAFVRNSHFIDIKIDGQTENILKPIFQEIDE